MSRRKIRLMRALVNGILAALALLALGSLPSAVAEVPGPGDGPHPVALLPLGASLQHQLVLTNPLLAPAELVRTVVLPDRAPLALPHTAHNWQAHLDPAALVLALRTALETPVAPPSRSVSRSGTPSTLHSGSAMQVYRQHRSTEPCRPSSGATWSTNSAPASSGC